MLLQTKPDLIVDFGSVRDTYVSLAERVQAQTGIPYILIDGRFENTAASVRLLGAILGVEERPSGSRATSRALWPRSTPRSPQVPQEERPRVYLARGPMASRPGSRARSTPRSSSGSARSTSPRTARARRGIAQVPIEQVMVWNPDVVITWDRNFYETVRARPTGRAWPRWQARVYLSPTAPYGWIDRPPSLNRLIGLQWLAGCSIPDHIKQDLRDVTRSFYSLFYHVDLTDADLDRLLQWAAAAPRSSWRIGAGAPDHAAAGARSARPGGHRGIHRALSDLARRPRGARLSLSGEVPPEPLDLDTVLFFVRLPRIAAAVLIGGALAAAGAAYQGLFRNPLVSPDILGVSAGAGLGAVLGIFLSLPVLGIQLLAFVVGARHGGLVYWSPPRCAGASRCSCWCWRAWCSARSPAR